MLSMVNSVANYIIPGLQFIEHFCAAGDLLLLRRLFELFENAINILFVESRG